MEHHATILWRRTSQTFTYDSYNRAHEWRFHGVTVPASAAPDFRGDATMVNPEEAFVASLSSCHMLTFLWLAAKEGFVADSYEDNAAGVMTKNERGVSWVSAVRHACAPLPHSGTGLFGPGTGGRFAGRGSEARAAD